MKRVPPKDWKWFGTHGHFICGRWCRFHMATQVGRFLVSTVGEYVHPRHSGGGEQAEAKWMEENWPGEEIGCGRKYETMVFEAGEPCDAEDCLCGLPSISGMEIDFRGYNDRRAATEGHRELCAKWAAKQDYEPEEEAWA